MELRPKYPELDWNQFIHDLIESKNIEGVLSNCEFDSFFFEAFKSNLNERIRIEIEKNGIFHDPIPPNKIGFLECNTPESKKLSQIKKVYQDCYNLCINRSIQPLNWSDNLPLENNPCCNFTEKILKEFTEKFNPSIPIFTVFFKAFYYHSLTDFDNFKTNAEQIEAILNQGRLFNKEQRDFFFEKISEDVKNKNSKVHYVERLIQFKKEFIKSPYSTCTSEEFKTDISELCENCPLTDKINQAIENQIIFQANIKKDILPPKKFIEYIYSEIQSASEAMDRVYSIELQNKDNINDQHRANRIEIFIWNKERIKALKNFTTEAINSPSNKKRSSKNDPSFVQLFKNNEDRLNKFIQLLKGIHFSALDENSTWIYNSRKSSIVACFNALEELGFIKKLNNDTQLYRVVKTHIDFQGNEKLFRNQFNQDDYDDFYNKFNSHLK